MCQEFFKTRFISVPINTSSNTGIPIGQGACKAVRLKLNALIRNAKTGLNVFVSSAYYGDSQSQECELVAGFNPIGGLTATLFYQSEWTPKIYCQNLEEVFIRSQLDDLVLQVMILD